MDKKEKKENEKPKIHYVCTGGCGFVSENPGKCPTLGCPRARNPLTLCQCSDGKHGNLLYLNAQRKAK